MKILSIALLAALTGCSFLDPVFDVIHDYEERAATRVVSSSERLLCNSPLTTVIKQYEGARFASWWAMCGHKVDGDSFTPMRGVE